MKDKPKSSCHIKESMSKPYLALRLNITLINCIAVPKVSKTMFQNEFKGFNIKSHGCDESTVIVAAVESSLLGGVSAD